MKLTYIAGIGFCVFINVNNIYGTVIIKGSSDEANSYAFAQAVTAKVYDHKTASFIVGLQDGAGEYCVSIGHLPSQEFLPLAADATLTDHYIELMSLIMTPDPETPFLIGVVDKANDTSYSQSVLTILDPATTKTSQTVDLNDASGNLKTGGISNCVGAEDIMFVALKNNVNEPFGVGKSGIALVKVLLDGDSLEAVPVDATSGLAGNRAFEIDVANNSLNLFSSNPFSGPINIPRDSVAMYWDEKLQLLYLMLSITSVNNTPVANSLVKLYIDSATGKLIAKPAVKFNAVNGDNIVATTIVNQSIIANKIAVMHTSTGPSYLVVSKDLGFYALPLVNSPELIDDHGMLAAINQNLSNGNFTTPATFSGDLFQSIDISCRIGDPDNMPADLTAAFNVSSGSILTDMQVVGDTVYISIKNANFGYVLSSQALFDEQGRIVRWTPWSQRAVPANCFPGLAMPGTGVSHSGKVNFFSIDTVDGKAWIVEGDTGRLVGRTEWTVNFLETDLAYMINKHLNKGCLSALDLHHKSSLIGLNKNNYCLFGGISTVAFARTRDQDLSIISPAGTISDYTDPANFVVTYLPGKNIPVTSLEYTAETSNNYFLAGTQNGVYIFGSDQNGTGFNASDLSTIDSSPFNSGSWILAPADELQKPIVSLCCAQANIYIVTYDPDDAKGAYKLYRLDPKGKTTISDTFISSNLKLLAQTKQNSFEKTKVFFNVGIAHTPSDESDDPRTMPEQLFLATNNGLWQSTSNSPQGITDATNDADSAWQLITTFQYNLFQGIGTIDVPVQHTMWPFMVPRSSACEVSLRSDINQISLAQNEIVTDFAPVDFNTNSYVNFLNTLDPIRYFWTDGARRFFIFSDLRFGQTGSAMASLPYDTQNSMVDDPYFFNESAVLRSNQFYWIKIIHDLGIV